MAYLNRDIPIGEKVDRVPHGYFVIICGRGHISETVVRIVGWLSRNIGCGGVILYASDDVALSEIIGFGCLCLRTAGVTKRVTLGHYGVIGSPHLAAVRR